MHRMAEKICGIYYVKYMNTIQKGKYRHYKGHLYELIGTARHSETLEDMAIYKALYGDFGIWVRPLKMFLEDIDINGKIQKRFEFLEGAL